SSALRFDATTGAASGEIVVDARSGQTGSAARDHRMHEVVLESEKFPKIVFRPSRVEGAIADSGSSAVKIHGVLSIHGADHEITVPADVHHDGVGYDFTARIDVPYVKWGMKNPGNF